MKKFLKGFLYAGHGAVLCLSERNFRFHLCAAGFVIFFAAGFYELSRTEWAVLVLTIGAVLTAEAVNTALERLCDRVTTEIDEHVRSCKDIAAGAVLLTALVAVGVGVALFWDTERFAAIWEFYSGDVWRAVSLLAAVIGAGAVVFLPERKG